VLPRVAIGLLAMRSANYVWDLMVPLVQKMGITTANNLLVDLAQAYGVFINGAVKKLHDRFDFPDFVLLEQRTPDANHYIPWEQSTQKVIHRALKVYQRDPRVTIPQFEIPFHLDVNGVHCGYDHGTSVWLRFMEPAPQFSGSIWFSSLTYKIGDQLLDMNGDGNNYISLQNSNTNHQPYLSPTWWQLVPFPESIADLTVRLAFCETLREDGQFDKAQAEEAAVIQEAISKVAAMINVAFDTISDQARTASRYHPPVTTIVAPGGGGGK
jgi:hypothetical protein